MPFQVGMACYSTAVDAGRAACSAFENISTINGNIVKTVSCTSSDFATGALNLSIASTDIVTNITTTESISQLITFPPCVEGDYVEAAGIIFAGLLSIWCIWICGWKLLSFLGWSRGENA